MLAADATCEKTMKLDIGTKPLSDEVVPQWKWWLDESAMRAKEGLQWGGKLSVINHMGESLKCSSIASSATLIKSTDTTKLHTDWGQ